MAAAEIQRITLCPIVEVGIPDLLYKVSFHAGGATPFVFVDGRWLSSDSIFLTASYLFIIKNLLPLRPLFVDIYVRT